MLDKKRIEESEKNSIRYIAEGLLFVKHEGIANYVHFFLKNAETSLVTSQALFDLSTDKERRRAAGLGEQFESYLWVVVSAYYSMYYAALALLAKHRIKTGDKLVHKVVADTLIAKFLPNQQLAKLIESYDESRETALELVGAEEKAFGLVESFDQERRKRHRLQYELGEVAKQNLAKTSLERASAFIAEIRNIIRE